jgi:hypothetical protein
MAGKSHFLDIKLLDNFKNKKITKNIIADFFNYCVAKNCILVVDYLKLCQ